MYMRSNTWIESGPCPPPFMPAIAAAAGRMRARRGMGQVTTAGGGGISPASACYDPTHDAGENHCASLSNVITSALNPFTNGLTTTCSDAEQLCLSGGATPVGSTVSPFQAANILSGSTATDPCSTSIGMSCMSIGVIAAILIGGIVLLKVNL